MPESDQQQILNRNISSILKTHGIPEDLDKKKYENLVPTTDKANEKHTKSSVDTKVKELRRLGKFDKDREKSMSVLVTFNTEHETRLVLTKSYEKRTELKEEIFSDAYVVKRRCLERKSVFEEVDITDQQRYTT